VDPKLLTIYIDPGAFRNVRKVANRAVLHFHYKVIAGDVDHFGSLDFDLVRRMFGFRRGLRLYLRTHCYGENPVRSRHEQARREYVSKSR